MQIGSSMSTALAAVRLEIERIEQVGRDVARLDAGTDLASSAVELIRARHGVSANLAVVRTADELAGSLLDVLR